MQDRSRFFCDDIKYSMIKACLFSLNFFSVLKVFIISKFVDF